ncbi:MAG: GNAT family N-acetyltransferase [Phycisphaerales bacterium]
MDQDQRKVSCSAVRLRAVGVGDLPELYSFQDDPQALEMAVVFAKNFDAFVAHWQRILADESVLARAIEVDGELVGSISCFVMDGVDSVGYWIDRKQWGRGIASRALELLLVEVEQRPLHARVAASNLGSIRVLEKCGFKEYAREESPDDGKFPVCLEALMRLDRE